MAFDPQDSSHIWAATSGQGLFYSGDGGATWVADNAGLTDLNVVALSVQPVSPYDVLAVTYGGKAFWAAISPTATPTVTSVSSVTPNPRSTSVSSVNVTFSGPIDLSTFDYHDVILNCNDAAIPLSGTVTTSLVSGATYQISGLAGFTGGVGRYVLTVNAAGVKDSAGNVGTGFASTSWVMQTVTPTLSWKSTSLDLFGTTIGASATPNGNFFASDGFDLDRVDRPGQDLDLGRGRGGVRGGGHLLCPVGPEHHARRRGRRDPQIGRWRDELVQRGRPRRRGACAGDRVPAGQRERDLCGGRVRLGAVQVDERRRDLTNPISSRAVTSIAIDPSHTSVVYVGMAKYLVVRLMA